MIKANYKKTLKFFAHWLKCPPYQIIPYFCGFITVVEINGWLNFSNVFTNVLYQCWKQYVFKSTFNSDTNIWGHIVEYFKWVYQSLGERFELKALLQNEGLFWFELTKLQFKITKSSFMASFNFKWVYQGLV